MARRDDILDAALHLFAEHGYAGTTVAQIESAVGLRPGSGGLYRHVGSKRELLDAAVDRALTRRYAPPRGPFASPGAALAAAVLALVDADPDLWRLIIRDGDRLPLDLDDVYARLAQPAFEQSFAWIRAHGADDARLEARVAVGVSALLYLRISQFTYGRTPAGIDEGAFTAVVAAIFDERQA